MSKTLKSTPLASLLWTDDSTPELLASAGVCTLGDLTQKTGAELMTISNGNENFDALNLADLVMVLEDLGFADTNRSYPKNEEVVSYLDTLLSKIRLSTKF